MKATKTATRIEARQSETIDAWTVGVFEFWTDHHGDTRAYLVEQIATFSTPDGDALGIARAREYADHLRTARASKAVQVYRVTNPATGRPVTVTVPE